MLNDLLPSVCPASSEAGASSVQQAATVWHMHVHQKDLCSMYTLSAAYILLNRAVLPHDLQAGVAVSKWAIEYEQPAADAFKLNNPEAAVFCNNCNAILVVSGSLAAYTYWSTSCLPRSASCRPPLHCLCDDTSAIWDTFQRATRHQSCTAVNKTSMHPETGQKPLLDRSPSQLVRIHSQGQLV
jgi:hypothetical protein